MKARSFIVVAAVLLLGACDASEKPETLSVRTPLPTRDVSMPTLIVPIWPGRVPDATDPNGRDEPGAFDDKSLRLRGPGVSRAREVRV